jgi:hypothetical protein
MTMIVGGPRGSAANGLQRARSAPLFSRALAAGAHHTAQSPAVQASAQKKPGACVTRMSAPAVIGCCDHARGLLRLRSRFGPGPRGNAGSQPDRLWSAIVGALAHADAGSVPL